MMSRGRKWANTDGCALRHPAAVLNRHFETDSKHSEAGLKLWRLAGCPVAGALQAEAAGQIRRGQGDDAGAVPAVRRA